MRLLYVFIFISPLFAQSSSQMIETARAYEAKGDIQNAMEWYKKAALGLEPEAQTAEALPDDLPAVTTPLESTLQEMPPYVRQYERAKLYDTYLDPYEDKDSQQTILQMLSGTFGLMPYQVNYLLPVSYNARDYKGRKQTETKFQFSFQKELAHDWLGLDESYSFGYTQVSWWQILQDSSPFRETNYQPELFITVPYKEKESAIKGFKFGYLHASNGKDGHESRSWDRVYASTFLQAGGIFISPRVWYRLKESKRSSTDNKRGDDNPDIHHYLGYGDLTLMYPWGKNLFKGTFTNNLSSSDNRSGMNLEWSFPLSKSGVFGFVQYYYGYGESLIDYDKLTNRISIGFALSR
ncbi:MAG: phospholipase A [Campylobacterales bacterium]|nr:phospholipase A [Campylobacterales bacterium]